ncbi:alpha-L-fucosidase [Arthrobacter sp. Rue61a]|uniref:alpha-L-fucosidase n=1 Tax=Paenarthrobacter aurescens (strain TC1) TaxID=290340 RepID=A1RB68_PAEAT|nr:MULTISPECIES: alpha-L-fucosidase [Micrococcaceae]ABM09785.1 putative alpha-L-fucosidase [Paenarthrobacter aurescens TC1]AFR30806.1 plasma alpha-L-fucosidase Fuca [Arthrobacter sp. Rue61a]
MIQHAPWFEEARFGMFVHWGIYALPARHEWVMNIEETTVEEYSKYFQRFDPDLYDPREWARAARDAGMKYVVLTTKHHDGFCLWDSALTDYKATNTPAGRDLIAPYVEALRAEGLKVGFYHSLIDWHHPDFTVDGVHPQRNADDVESLNAGRDMARYREYLHGQVRELLSNYGTIDYLFFDFSYSGTSITEFWGGKGRKDWDSEALLAMVRELQPGIVVNDRLDIPGDVVTPEQYQPTEPMMRDGVSVTWEACQTLNGSWGYDRDNLNYKSVDLLIRMLVDGVSNGGNLLLNVGPTGRGSIDPRALSSLEGIGAWMKLHSRAIYGAGASRFTAPPDARYTQRGDRLYVHLFAWPFEYIHLPDLAGKVEYAQLLNDASEVFLKEVDPDQQAFNTIPGGQPPGTLTIKLPVQRPDVAVPVLELFLKQTAADPGAVNG